MIKSKASNPNAYQHYSVQDFDSYDCLKLSKRFYLALLFILRGYIVWLLSVTNMRDRVSIIQWVYPETSLFYLSLFSGAVGLFVLLIISLRRPDAYAWVPFCWRYTRVIIIVALLFDLSTHIVGYLYWQLSSTSWLITQSIVTAVLIYMCYSSERLNLNLNEFPQKLPEE
ncbi:MAG: DUF2919 domain-containing protein [Colwellia sp.]|nr:DUF2919 domain-containing protein [Colwellia sp.]MCW8866603.1 DUF2919 domain-containing protein [Colwellia sp.]MCW9082728.1 DUF2919 domain-containing protein [Colwellia sp.]